MNRKGLRMVMDAEPDLAVVAEAAEVDAALYAAVAEHPDVVVLDLTMPGRPTLAAIPDFRDRLPETAIVVLTMNDDPAFARQALHLGVRAYVLKEAAESELVDAVRAAANGSTYLNPRLGASLVGPGAPARAAGPEAAGLAVGSVFAGHRIEAVAGRGAMGVVYRAVDLALDRTVALKVIAPELAGDAVFRKRFEHECRLAAAIEHPRVVQIHHAGTEDGLLYVTMRYVDGSDLRALLSRERRLAPARAAAILAQVADGLDEAHRLGLVHRDVKPANILLATSEGRERAYVADFGLIRRRGEGSGLTATGFAIGTPDYMAPEQARGDPVDARTDIYALGCVAFRALTGCLPFERATDLDKLWAHVHDPPPHLLDACPELPAQLDAVVDRALAKDPADRQPTAAEFARDLLATAAPRAV
jgi:CheY-like chemotaxis protein